MNTTKAGRDSKRSSAPGLRPTLAAIALTAVGAQAAELGLPSYLGSPYDPVSNPVLVKASAQSGICTCSARVRELVAQSGTDQGPGDREIAQDTAAAREYLPWMIEDQRRLRAERVQVP